LGNAEPSKSRMRSARHDRADAVHLIELGDLLQPGLDQRLDPGFERIALDTHCRAVVA
jgi:hypothetical protein